MPSPTVPDSEHRFLVTYRPRPQWWCPTCHNAVELADLKFPAVEAAVAAHRCGPRPSSSKPARRGIDVLLSTLARLYAAPATVPVFTGCPGLRPAGLAVPARRGDA